ncbi:hypothetical protein ACFOD4_06940 [Pseudoroseomonas globiformis]|uniref:Uncharacterized protein n=1 Tax=Teichococcus globiformis TaxID=2307229 RepID=A0ABV7FZS7_9PROT
MPKGGDPFRGIARAAAAEFADQGAGLQNRPAAMARAAARLEFLMQSITQDPRYAALPASNALAMGGAVREVRQALGIAPSALPEQVIGFLTDAANAMEAGREPAWPMAIFPGGPVLTRQRLAAPGPLAEAAIATGRLDEAIAALDAASAWGGVASTPAPGG